MHDTSLGLYTAFKSKDVRFDGHFFVGVSSTGIYCRPICRAKLPKPEHCHYYPTAAAAEVAGYRPCLLCRPELAPGAPIPDATTSLVHRAAHLLEENCGSTQRIAELAAHLGCTDRHLRRAFAAQYHVSPVQYLQTCRLLLAKSLLTDTDLSVLDVAMAAGFGSLRRFNALFRDRYQLSPTALRRQTAQECASQSDITLALGYRPPYPWNQMLDFLRNRAIAGVERIESECYSRTVRLVTADHKPVCGWVRVSHSPGKNILRVTLSASLLPVLPQVLARVRHLFDLNCDPDAIYEILSSMNDIRPGLCTLGTRLPGCFDPFELTVRAVLGQQITVKAASTLASRLVSAHGTPIRTGIVGLTHLFPSPADILALGDGIGDHLGPLGITSIRAHTIASLAQMFDGAKIRFDPAAMPEIEGKKLMAIRGIGSWTANYIVMRTMAWPDAFLETDAAIRKALAPRSPKEMLQLAEGWRPWRSYATINLWNSLQE